MDSITTNLGMQQFYYTDGEPRNLRKTFRHITREGANGVGLAQLGRRAEQFELRVERDYFDEASALTASIVTFPNMVGFNATIVIGTRTYNNCFILDWIPGTIEVGTIASGGVVGGNVWLTGTFVFIYALPA